ncbi:MAG: hypothetical protein J7J22_02245 [Candidatus Verstraetearchaeota archaeon]|nr:hypothetical protein [Candidatus Verstraetearchaeota archaeon]
MGIFLSEINSILFQLGFGGIAGFAVGYALKKVLKITIIIIGLVTLAIMYLQWQGILNVNYEQLVGKIEGFVKGIAGGSTSMVSQVVANLPFAAAFLAGFTFGFKKG